MDRRALPHAFFAFVLFALALAGAGPIAAQAPPADDAFALPTPEEYASRAERAENAPLFQSHDILRMTLRTDIEWLRDERNDSVEVEGTATFIDLDGSEVTKPVDTRTRGNWRRDKRNCNFPPLRLDFPTGQMEGTVFEGQDKLKLVTPCDHGSDNYQNYVLDEYLAYRLLNVLTPTSYRVRLVEVTYVDIEDDYDTRTKIGFLIEDEEQMAARSRATVQEVSQFHPARTDAEFSNMAAVFNYMIANTDWDPAYFHNVVLLRTEDARFLTVPYDFDFTGLVNARYATVDPSLQNRIRRVTQRLYRGFCMPGLSYETTGAIFREKKAELEAVVTDFAALGLKWFDEDDAKDMIEFFEDFWEVLEDPEEFQDEIIEGCRDLQTGRTP